LLTEDATVHPERRRRHRRTGGPAQGQRDRIAAWLERKTGTRSKTVLIMMKIPLMRMRVVIQEPYNNIIVIIIVVVVVNVVIITNSPRVDVACSAWISFAHHHLIISLISVSPQFLSKTHRQHRLVRSKRRLFHAPKIV